MNKSSVLPLCIRKLLNLASVCTLALLLWASPPRVAAQAPPPMTIGSPRAYIDYGIGIVLGPKLYDGVFAPVALNAKQTVTITMQFDPSQSGQVVIVEPLDGGTVTGADEGAVVDQNGQVSFQFTGPDIPGLSRISVHQSEGGVIIQFWILDLANPANNPPNLLGI